MKTTFSKTSKFIALAMMFLASFTVFTACGGDDDDESNTVMVNKTEDGVYKIKFQLAQTEANKTTTMAGSYEGKSMSMTDPAAQ